MKKLLTLAFVSFISCVVLSQNYTNPTSARDTEPLSLQKISNLMNRKVVTASVEWVRTNTVTAYTYGDCVSTNETTDTKCYPFTFTNCVPTTGGGIVMKVRLSTSYGAGAFPASRLYFFNSTNVYLQNDNAAFSMRWTNNAASLDYVDIPACTVETGNDATHGLQRGINLDARLAFNAGVGVTDLCGYLVIKGSYIPIVSEKFELQIDVLEQ